MTTMTSFDPKELEAKVKAMYWSVAENPKGEFHFEMGRAMAERSAMRRQTLTASPQSRSSPLPASAITSISPT
jgi:hypothetical protein